jgi:hypothetical protein
MKLPFYGHIRKAATKSYIHLQSDTAEKKKETATIHLYA